MSLKNRAWSLGLRKSHQFVDVFPIGKTVGLGNQRVLRSTLLATPFPASRVDFSHRKNSSKKPSTGLLSHENQQPSKQPPQSSTTFNNHQQPTTIHQKIDWDRIPTDLTFISCYLELLKYSGFFRGSFRTGWSCSLKISGRKANSRFRSCWCSFHHVLSWAGAFSKCCGASAGRCWGL